MQSSSAVFSLSIFILLLFFSPLSAGSAKRDIPGEDDSSEPATGHDHGSLMGMPSYENVTEARCQSAYAVALFNSYQCHDIYNLFANKLLTFQISPSTLTYLCGDRECFSLIRTSLNYLRGNCSAFLRPGFMIPNLRDDFEDIICRTNSQGKFCATVLTLGVGLSAGSHDIIEPPSMDDMHVHRKRAIQHEGVGNETGVTSWNLTAIRSKLTDRSVICDNCVSQTLKRLSDDQVYRKYVGNQLAVQRMFCLNDEGSSSSCLEKTFDWLSSTLKVTDVVNFDKKTLLQLAPSLCSSPCAMKVMCCALSADEYDATVKLCARTPAGRTCYQLANESIESCGTKFSVDSNITFPSTCYGLCKTKWLQAEEDNGCCLYTFTQAFSPSSLTSLLNHHSSCHDLPPSSSGMTGHNHGSDTAAAQVMAPCALPLLLSGGKKFDKWIYFSNVKFSYYQAYAASFSSAVVRDLAVGYVVSLSSISNVMFTSTEAGQVAVSFTITTTHSIEEQVITNTPPTLIQFDYLSAMVNSAGLFNPSSPIYAMEYSTRVGSSALSAAHFVSHLVLSISFFFLLLI